MQRVSAPLEKERERERERESVAVTTSPLLQESAIKSPLFACCHRSSPLLRALGTVRASRFGDTGTLSGRVRAGGTAPRHTAAETGSMAVSLPVLLLLLEEVGHLLLPLLLLLVLLQVGILLLQSGITLFGLAGQVENSLAGLLAAEGFEELVLQPEHSLQLHHLLSVRYVLLEYGKVATQRTASPVANDSPIDNNRGPACRMREFHLLHLAVDAEGFGIPLPNRIPQQHAWALT